MFEQKLLVTYKDITNKIEGLIINILSKTIQIILIQIFIWFISLNTNANMNIPKSSSTGYKKKLCTIICSTVLETPFQHHRNS